MSVAPGFKLYLEKQIRYEDRFTHIESDLNEVGLGTKFNKYLSFRLNYRFVPFSGDELRHRFDGNALIDFPMSRFHISNRFRIQNENIEDHDGNYSELEFRNRLRIGFDLAKKIKPYFGGEIFLAIGDDATNRNKYRLTAGTVWKVKKRVEVELLYHFQKELRKANADTSHIFLLKFNYSF